MGLEYKIEIEDHASGAINALLVLLAPEALRELNQVAGTASLLALRKYHGEFDSSGGWTNPSLSTHGAGRNSTGFGMDITEAWGLNDVDSDGVSLVNGHPLLSFKIRGGDIRAKDSKWLTIPMVPEAHGVKAADYANELFINKKKTALLEQLEDGSIRAVYALRKSVTQKPTKGAMPEEDVYLGPFMETIIDHLDQALAE
jgi:hypothetical protein